MVIKGQIVDIENEFIYPGEIHLENGKIKKIIPAEHQISKYILPGFIDAHVHIESSMLVPSEFAKIAVQHGTVATVSDPHEIANVLGLAGVNFMIENGKKVPFKFNFGAPSCVPATHFETAGATIDSGGIQELLEREEIKYLAEMMNYPGVIYQDAEVMKKIALAHKQRKPVDGHAPGLRGKDLDQYIAAGISTDHESFSYEEGLEKLEKGMHLLIREGSAAKNFNALIDLAPTWFDKMMFCSDDKHPDDLLVGHINELVKRGLKRGISLFKLLKMACINPIHHYQLDVGYLRENDPADFIIVDDLKDFNVSTTYINGECVYANQQTIMPAVSVDCPNHFECQHTSANSFKLKPNSTLIRVIEALDGALITNELAVEPKTADGYLVSDTERDILKIVVVNRYKNSELVIAFIKNFGLKEGAIASSVAHDSHNIIAVGTTDVLIAKAVNAIIECKGGIAAVDETDERILPLPVAGIMSDKSADEVGEKYQAIDLKAKTLGSTLSAPFMTLSFMALLVIPQLKLSDLGLFDGQTFGFTTLEK